MAAARAAAKAARPPASGAGKAGRIAAAGKVSPPENSSAIDHPNADTTVTEAADLSTADNPAAEALDSQTSASVPPPQLDGGEVEGATISAEEVNTTEAA